MIFSDHFILIAPITDHLFALAPTLLSQMADLENLTAAIPHQQFYKNYKEALKKIRDFEVETTTKFVIWRKNKQFGCKGIASA